MSTYTEVRVYCDEGDCDRTYVVSGHHGGISRAWAVYMARLNGWAVRHGGDYARCAEHRKRPRRTKDEGR